MSGDCRIDCGRQEERLWEAVGVMVRGSRIDCWRQEE